MSTFVLPFDWITWDTSPLISMSIAGRVPIGALSSLMTAFVVVTSIFSVTLPELWSFSTISATTSRSLISSSFLSTSKAGL